MRFEITRSRIFVICHRPSSFFQKGENLETDHNWSPESFRIFSKNIAIDFMYYMNEFCGLF